ncbi:glycosyltransferase family 2 protein [Verrucomicrobiota bacterium]
MKNTGQTKEPENGPLVSIIVLTVNATGYLEKCLHSLSEQTYSNIEIIVVDNGSTEDIAGFLEKEFPAVHCVRIEKNIGFAGGNNKGVKVAKGEYIALINNDAVADANWIMAMVKTAETDSMIGAIASAVVDGKNPSLLDSFGMGIAIDGMSRQARHGSPVSDLSAPERVLAVSGCACLLRSKTLKETGLFDERFFAYCEDTDLSLRLCWAGWKIIAEPRARVAHYHSHTVGRFSVKKVFWVERNHYWVALKNFPFFLVFLIPLVTLWRLVIQLYVLIAGERALTAFVKTGGFCKVGLSVVGANLVALSGAPSMIMAGLFSDCPKRISTGEMIRLLLKYRLSVYEIITGKTAKRE